MRHHLGGYVYMLTNQNNTVIYIGVTENILMRVFQHKEKFVPGFTAKYHVQKLVWYEQYDHIENAITREKQLKNWKRQWKIELIKKQNPYFNDLYESLIASS